MSGLESHSSEWNLSSQQKSVQSAKKALSQPHLLALIVLCCTILVALSSPASAGSLRFYGNIGEADRLTVPLDPNTQADVGAGDFTLEVWLRGELVDNLNTIPVACDRADGWLTGAVVLDRDRRGIGRKFGLSLDRGRASFGVSTVDANTGATVCSPTSDQLLDGQWHHLVAQRNATAGRLELFVDGRLSASRTSTLTLGDLSFPDGGAVGQPATDSLLMLGGSKSSGVELDSFSGSVDELRVSSGLRYNAGFVRPTKPFALDADTKALFHLDDASGLTALDDSGARNHGTLVYGGSPAGPVWSSDSPFGALPLPSGAIPIRDGAGIKPVRFSAALQAPKRIRYSRLRRNGLQLGCQASEAAICKLRVKAPVSVADKIDGKASKLVTIARLTLELKQPGLVSKRSRLRAAVARRAPKQFKLVVEGTITSSSGSNVPVREVVAVTSGT